MMIVRPAASRNKYGVVIFPGFAGHLSATAGRNDENLVVSTLVYQLTQCSPELRRRVAKVIERQNHSFTAF